MVWALALISSEEHVIFDAILQTNLPVYVHIKEVGDGTGGALKDIQRGVRVHEEVTECGQEGARAIFCKDGIDVIADQDVHVEELQRVFLLKGKCRACKITQGTERRFVEGKNARHIRKSTKRETGKNLKRYRFGAARALGVSIVLA